MKRLIFIAARIAALSGQSQTKIIDSFAIQLANQKQDFTKVNMSIQLINKDGILRGLNSTGYLNLEKKYTILDESQIFEAHELAKITGNAKELLNNYKLLMNLDSIKGSFQNAYNWQRAYSTLELQLDSVNQT